MTDPNVVSKSRHKRSMLHFFFTFSSTDVWTCIRCFLCGLINLIIARHVHRGREDCGTSDNLERSFLCVTLHSSLNYCSPSPLLHPYHICSCTNKYLPQQKHTHTHTAARAYVQYTQRFAIGRWCIIVILSTALIKLWASLSNTRACDISKVLIKTKYYRLYEKKYWCGYTQRGLACWSLLMRLPRKMRSIHLSPVHNVYTFSVYINYRNNLPWGPWPIPFNVRSHQV